jgi:C4-dicarboxylate-specific signal transduction histidine kinase
VLKAGKTRLTPGRLAALYLVISVVWILASSEFLLIELESPVAITTFEILTRLAFVAATGVLIYWICRRLLDRLLQSQESLREAEKHQPTLERQLEQAQRLEAIGRLAGGIAYDFYNILTVILACCHLLEDGSDTSGPMRIKMIHSAADRAASLTRQLLAFSRHQVPEVRVVNVNSMVMETAALLERLLGDDVRLVRVLAPGLGNVMADPSQITQILMNLCPQRARRDAQGRHACDSHGQSDCRRRTCRPST